MVIEVIVKELGVEVEYTSKMTGEVKHRQEVRLVTDAPYPDEFNADMFGKTAKDLGIKVGDKIKAKLNFIVDQVTSTKDNTVWFKQKVVLWGIE